MSKGRFSPSRRQPNERLKRERLLRGWSQVYVADTLDTDNYTVNRWERGRAQPSPYFRQKLCALFEKNAYDLGLVSPLSECPITASSSLLNDLPTTSPWFIPHLRNAYFTGREECLQTLHSFLMASQSSAPTQVIALSGLSGVGKTQVAVEYAYRYASEYTATLWIEAETMEDMVASMLRIANFLELPLEKQETDRHRIITAVQQWLTTHSQWLLIWDGLENLELLQHLPLSAKQGVILITTCCQALGTMVRGLSLRPMEREEGILFVLRRAKVLELEATSEHLHQFATVNPREYAAASALVIAMGGLPLALDQVGAYIDEAGCNLAGYLQLYQQQRVHLLKQRGFLRQSHPLSVTDTFLRAKRSVEQEQKEVANVLSVCTLLHSEVIPEELFVKGAMQLGLEALATNPIQFDRTIAVLRRLSLLQRHPETHTLSIHCLVQTVLQEDMSEQERIKWLKKVSAALNTLFPEVHADTWKQCERLIPHALAVARHIPTDTKDENLADLLRKVADYLREHAQYEQAEALDRRALYI